MTIKEINTVHTVEDEYNLANNNSFVFWFDSAKQFGYETDLTIEDIQGCVDSVSSWYERNITDEEIEESSFNSTEELLRALPRSYMCILRCIEPDKERNGIFLYYRERNTAKIEQFIKNQNVNIELRRKVIQAAALEILYTANDSIEAGYKRAKRLINDFNDAFYTDITTYVLDEAYYGLTHKFEKTLSYQPSLR